MHAARSLQISGRGFEGSYLEMTGLKQSVFLTLHAKRTVKDRLMVVVALARGLSFVVRDKSFA